MAGGNMASAASLVLVLALVLAMRPRPIDCNVGQSDKVSKYKSFSVRSKFQVAFGGGQKISYEIHEKYSADQMRAVIDYKFSGNTGESPEQRGTYYLDRKFKTALQYDEVESRCREFDPKLFLDLIQISKFTDDYSEDDLVVGPSKLVLFLLKFRDQFERSYVVEFNTDNKRVTSKYTHNFKELGQIFFELYYPGETTVRDHTMMPVKVEMESKQGGHLGTLSFSHFNYGQLAEPLPDFQILAKFDPFLTKTTVKCSSAMEQTRTLDPFQFVASSRRKFSFRAELRTAHDMRFDMFVAFDGRLGSMRVDFVDSEWDIVRLTSFKLNRVYHQAELRRTKEDSSNIFNNNKDSRKNLKYEPCVVAQLLPENSPEVNKVPLMGSLVAGTRSFVYMGKAEVRGIPVSVYESYKSSLPLWYDQYLAYKSERIRGPTLDTRWPDVDVDSNSTTHKSSIIYQTLLYVAENEDGAQFQPVMIELYSMNEASAVVHDKLTISIYDFNWYLSIQSFSGTALTDFFSLRDLCSTGENQHGRVELVLQEQIFPSSTAAESPQFDVSEVRNLELMAEIQGRLRLPSTMIYDIESRISKRANGNRMLMVSFSVAEHSPKLVQLSYHGRGSIDSDGPQAISFVECFLKAAHRGKPLLFAFHPEKKICLIGDSQLRYEIDEVNGEAEVYQIRHTDDPDLKASGRNEWLRRMSHGEEILKFQDQKFYFAGPENGPSGYTNEFILRKITVQPSDHDSGTILSAQTTSAALISKIPGFALSASDAKTRLISGERLDKNTWKTSYNSASEMDYSQCRAACLKDITCGSFSVCIQPSGIECILSEVKFDNGMFVSQKVHLSNVEAGQTISLLTGDEGGESIKLVKKINCDIHNKLFLDLFKLPKVTRLALYARPLLPVQNREQCAQICFNRIVHELKGSGSHGSEYLSSVIDLKSDEEFQEALDRQQLPSMRICKEFFYMSYNTILELPGEVRNELIEKGYNYQTCIPGNEQCDGGFCIPAHSTQPLIFENVSQFYVDMEFFEFKFETLYDEEFGVSLKGSPESEDIYRAIIWGKSITRDSITFLRSYIENGDNIQTDILGDHSKCAKFCFFQAQVRWPICRSYDIKLHKENNRIFIFCHLNSITLKQAIETHRFDLIEEPKGDEKVWHYDPHPGFVSQELAEESSWQLSHLDWEAQLNAGAPYRVHLFGILLILALGISCGIFLGTKLARFVTVKDSEKRSSKANLIISFQNQVNCDMTIN